MTEENRLFDNKEEEYKEEKKDENVVSDLFDDYNDTQRELLAIETRKVRSKIFTIAVIFFLSVLLSIAIANIPLNAALIDLFIIPGVLLGLGFLANKEPMVAISIAGVIVIGLWVLQIAVLGAEHLLRGLLVKGIIVYLIIAGFQSAKEAHKIKRDLNNK
jgi:hypothetical protein